MGISTFVLDGATNDRNLATALGGMTRGVTPLELTSAYGTFANRGIHVKPVAILRVVSRTGKVLEEAERKEKSVMSADNAAALTAMLEDVIRRGTGTRANIGRPAAGKTGTTSDYHDAWFVGYTPDLVTGVWIGNDSVSDLHGMSGGMTPAVIWQAFMQKALAQMPIRSFAGSSAHSDTSAKEETAVDHEKSSGEKKAADEKKKEQGKTSGSTSKSGGNTAPAEPVRSAPVESQGAAPEPGMGIEKGQN